MRGRIVLFCIFVASLVVVCGCGGSKDELQSGPSIGANESAPKSKVVEEKPFTFEEFRQTTPVTVVRDKNGLVFYRFTYTSGDSKTYTCELPAAMATGKYTRDVWTQTFDVYRKQAVAVVKPKKAKKVEKLDDLPLRSNNPSSQNRSESQVIPQHPGIITPPSGNVSPSPQSFPSGVNAQTNPPAPRRPSNF